MLSAAAPARDLTWSVRKPFTEYYFYVFPVAGRRSSTTSQELCTRKSRIVLSGVHEFHGVLIKGLVRRRVYILNLNPYLCSLPPGRPPPPPRMILSHRPCSAVFHPTASSTHRMRPLHVVCRRCALSALGCVLLSNNNKLIIMIIITVIITTCVVVMERRTRNNTRFYCNIYE